MFLENFQEEGVVVAVLDSGIDREKFLFEERLLKGINLFNPFEEVVDNSGHGTNIANIIASNNKNVKILPIKIMEENKIPSFPMSVAIIYAVLKGADVVNMSYQTEENVLDKLAIRYGKKKGVIFVAAAGNEAVEELNFPASFEEVISVGALNNEEEKILEISNFGEEVDFYVKGVIYLNKQGIYWSGTSISTAYLSGVVASLRENEPNLNEMEILEILKNNSTCLEKHEVRCKAIKIRKMENFNDKSNQ